MGTRALSIRVSDEAALAYEAASKEERRKLDALVSMQLAQTMQPGRSLEEIMSEMNKRARQRGLNAEILDRILHGEE
jgi:hypothetical protein